MSEMDRKISLVSNSVHFISAIAFVIKERGKFFLVVMNLDKVLFYKECKNAVGAKISFSKNFRDKVYPTGIRPNWTEFTPLNEDWKPLKWIKKMLEARRFDSMAVTVSVLENSNKE